MITTSTENGLTITAFPASWLRLYAMPIPLQPNRDHVVPVRIEEVLGMGSDVVAVLDGPMFGKCSSGDYSTYTCADLQYLFIDRPSGLYIESDRPNDGLTIFVRANGVAGWARDAAAPADATVAVQLFPALLEDGRVVASNTGTNSEQVWRAAAGIMADGRIGFAVFYGDMVAFARRLLAAGFVTAGYTDGGGSAGTMTREMRAGSAERRRIASALVAVRPRANLATTSVAVPVLALASVAVIAGATVWYVRRSRKSHE